MFLNLSYRDRDAWLLYRGGRNFAAFETESWGPRMVFNYFIHANQYVRFDLEWMGIRATEMQRFTLPVAHTKLAKVDEDQLGSTARDGFSISRMNLQLRYRWEIAPMSDLFLVYTKSSDLPNAIEYSFIDQFTETLGYASDESFVIKLRHRIGT